MSKDRAGARSKAGDGKREDVNRADLPNRYEQQGRCFFFCFLSPAAVKMSALSFLKKIYQMEDGRRGWREGEKLKVLGNTTDQVQ